MEINNSLNCRNTPTLNYVLFDLLRTVIQSHDLKSWSVLSYKKEKFKYRISIVKIITVKHSSYKSLSNRELVLILVGYKSKSNQLFTYLCAKYNKIRRECGW